MRVPIDLRHSHRLLNHGPLTLVSAASGDAAAVMAAQWVMPIDFDPPRIAIVMDAYNHTRELAERSNEVGVSIPVRAQADLAFTLGSVSGRDLDKLARWSVPTFAGAEIRAPLIDGCAAWLECRLVREPDIETRHAVFIAEVVAAWADDASWRDGRWQFPDDDHRTIHHMGRGLFAVTGPTVQGQKLP